MTEADGLRISLAMSARELAAMADMLRQAEEERDAAQKYALQTREKNILLSKRVRSLLRSHKHVLEVRAHLDALEDLFKAFADFPIATTDHLRRLADD